jgi:hypothetical protein
LERAALALGLVITALFTGAGCGGGKDDSADGGSGKSDGPTWTRVYNEVIVVHSCDSAFCHGGNGEGELSMLDQDDAYDNLVGQSAAGKLCKGKTDEKRVTPGKPDESLLVEKLSDMKPVCGDNMPPTGGVTDEQRKLVRDWIAAGAKND